jgi:hypothetical protein
LSFDGVGKKAIESILTISHIEMNAGVIASINMGFPTLARALINCKILLRAEVLYCLKLTF